MPRLAFLLAAAALSCCTHNYAYQNTSWGMSEKAVAKARPATQAMAASSGERFRFEHAPVAGRRATVAYRFSGDALAGVTVVFEPFKTDREGYLDFYKQVTVLLTEKYGSPEVDSQVMAAESKKYRIPGKDEGQTKRLWRNGVSSIELSCGGECDGSSEANSVAISYSPPVSRTEGL